MHEAGGQAPPQIALTKMVDAVRDGMSIWSIRSDLEARESIMAAQVNFAFLALGSSVFSVVLVASISSAG